MSHFVEMEVDFDVKNEAELVAALEQQFGEGHVEVHEKSQPLYGWHGDDRSKVSKSSQDYAPPCDIIVRRKYVGGSANDVGFKRQENGKYKSYISEYDNGSTFTKPRQGLVAQEYALRVAEKQLKKEGWKTFRTKLDNGSVKITAKDQVKLGGKW
jgi:hypothetical protein